MCTDPGTSGDWKNTVSCIIREPACRSEFGVEGMTNYEALRKTTAPEHFLPASKDNAYYFHRSLVE